MTTHIFNLESKSAAAIDSNGELRKCAESRINLTKDVVSWSQQ